MFVPSKERSRILSKVASENLSYAKWRRVNHSRSFRAMKTHALPKVTDEIRSYTQLQQHMHDALRAEHPEWVEANGDCPTCESYESRLAELLGLSSENKDHTVGQQRTTGSTKEL
jgi:hypothetical protein